MLSHAARRAVYALVALMALTTAVSAGNAKIHWVHETASGFLDSSPAIADLDGDGSLDICMTSKAGPVFVIDANGRQIWKTDLKETLTIAPTVADVIGDSAPELLVISQYGKLYCLEGATGDIIWAYDVVSLKNVDSTSIYISKYVGAEPIRHGCTSVVAADINADGDVEIITNVVKGVVVCLSAKGELLWTYDAGQKLPSAPAVGDLDGDGTAEIIMGSYEHPVIALSSTGKLLWKHARNTELPGVGRHIDVTSPVIADLDGDGKSEIITVDQNTMIAFNADGTVRWTTVASRRKVDGSLTVADADRDGSPEIYLVDLTGDVTRVNADGKRTWTTNIGQRCRRSFSVADVDGDGVIEIVVGAYTGKIHILTPDGKIKEELTIGAGTNATSSVADLVGDGSMCVVTPEISGNLSVYRWERGTVDPVILVPGYRGGNTRTASSFVSKATSTRRIQSLTTGSPYGRKPAFSTKISNPAKEKLSVSLTISDDTGVVEKTTKSVSGKSGKAKLRYKGSKLTGDAVFTCVISNSTGIIEKHTFTRTIIQYAGIVTALGEQVRLIESLISQLPNRKGIEERFAWLRGKLPELAKKVDGLSKLSATQLRELRDDLKALSGDLTSVETLATAAVTAGTGLTVSSANPWAPFSGTDELTEDRMGGGSLSVEAFHGEVESAALNIWNFTGTPRTLRVTMSALASGDKKTSDAIIVREVVASATQDIDMSADALPRLNEANTIVIPAWSARQLWFEIHTKTLSPGDWKAVVSLKDMAVSAEVVTAPLTVSVWSVTQSTKNAFKFCGWANTSPKGVLDDMLSHGMNVFTDGPKTAARFDADGKITGINYMLLDDYMKRLAGRGIVMFHNFAHLTGPAKMYSPVWNKAYVASVKLISARIKELGYDYGDYAYYPVDEPGLEEGRNVARFMLTAPLTREADPKIRIYANPTEGITTEHLKQMSPNIDIYAPYIAHIKTRYLDMMRVNSEEMWTYNCLNNVKHKSPLGYNRAQMWSCFNRGYTGGGIYTYSRDISSRTQKFWHMTNTEFDLVYPGNDGPVPSKRWEAVRDGIEDYSMLMALKSAANTPGADPALVKRARTLISVDAVTIGNYCGIDDDGFSPTESGLPAVRKVADKRWKMIVATRREMRDLLKAFAK